MHINCSEKLDYRWPLLVLFLACVFLVVTGIFGVLKTASFSINFSESFTDFSVFYQAGTFFLQGQDPWLFLLDSGTPFSYPPHSLVVVGFYNLFPYYYAVALHIVLMAASIAAICFCANRWFLKIHSFKDMTLAQLLPLALIIGNPYMATSIHQGQLTLPATAAVLLSWEFLRQGRWFVSGIFLGLATIKPQLSAIFVLWLIFTLNWRPLVVGGSLSLVMIIPASFFIPPLELFSSWLNSLDDYLVTGPNQPGLPYVVGFESLLAAYSIHNTGTIFNLLGVVAVGLLAWKKSHISPTLLVHLFFVVTFLFIYGHDYDYVAVVALWSWLLFIVLTRGNTNHILLVLFLTALFFLPQRLIRGIDIPLIQHSRTFLLPLCAWLVYLWGNQHGTNNEQKNPVSPRADV